MDNFIFGDFISKLVHIATNKDVQECMSAPDFIQQYNLD